MLEFALKQERSDSSGLLVHVCVCVTVVTDDDVFPSQSKISQVKVRKRAEPGRDEDA